MRRGVPIPVKRPSGAIVREVLVVPKALRRSAVSPSGPLTLVVPAHKDVGTFVVVAVIVKGVGRGDHAEGVRPISGGCGAAVKENETVGVRVVGKRLFEALAP